MFALKKITKTPIFWLLLVTILLAACTEQIEPTPEATASQPPTVASSPTPTLAEPTATPLPAAAMVNGERIPLAGFERELARYYLAQDMLGIENVDADEARQTVLNDMIDQVLLAQAAREAGTAFSDDEVNTRINQLAEDVDLEAWMETWGYTWEELVAEMSLQLLVADQRDRIAGSLPDMVEQVELRQVFAFTEEGANRAMANLNAGTPFEDVAFEFSPETGGYLGWVPTGYLLVPAVEIAVFDLPVGSYTEIIESDIGYHIVLVIDREVRPLTSDARLTLARQALYAWLEARRDASVIEVLID
ncbi:MAG: SurA N-terminal domain-containing protein [Brevefilum sp.]